MCPVSPHHHHILATGSVVTVLKVEWRGRGHDAAAVAAGGPACRGHLLTMERQPPGASDLGQGSLDRDPWRGEEPGRQRRASEERTTTPLHPPHAPLPNAPRPRLVSPLKLPCCRSSPARLHLLLASLSLSWDEGRIPEVWLTLAGHKRWVGFGRGTGVWWSQGSGGACDNRCGWILCPATAAERWDGGGFDGATVGLPVFPHKHTNLFFFSTRPPYPPAPSQCVTWSVPLSRSTSTCHFPPLAVQWDPWRVGVRGSWGW